MTETVTTAADSTIKTLLSFDASLNIGIVLFVLVVVIGGVLMGRELLLAKFDEMRYEK